MSVANNISKGFDELIQACERYKDCDKCNSECPMSVYCLEDTNVSFGEAVYDMSLTTLKAFIEGAEKLTDVITKEDYEAEKGNLFRCDPNE